MVVRSFGRKIMKFMENDWLAGFWLAGLAGFWLAGWTDWILAGWTDWILTGWILAG